MAGQPSRAFLLTSLVIAFPLLVLAFAQIFSVSILRLLGLFLPAVASSWPAAVIIWLLAAGAALAVCRMILRRAPAKGPPGAHSR